MSATVSKKSPAMARSIKDRFGQAAYIAYKTKGILPGDISPPVEAAPPGFAFALEDEVLASKWPDPRVSVVVGFSDPDASGPTRIYCQYEDFACWRDPVFMKKKQT